jgi:hypothetical protein
MGVLKHQYENQDDIPESFRELYSERGGKFELTGIDGVKTSADVERLQTALTKERDEHKAARERLKPWADLDHDEVISKLDRIPELEAAAQGKLDDEQIDQIVSRRVEGTIRSKLSPLERQLKKEQDEKTALLEMNQKLVGQDRRRRMQDAMRKQLSEAKALPDAFDDAFMLAEHLFEETDDGQFITREVAGFTPGLDPAGLVAELQEKRRHWWPESVGGGSRGSGGGGGAPGGRNPFSAEHWSLTEQGRILRQHGRERAEQLAKAAGTTVGGGKPKPRKG